MSVTAASRTAASGFASANRAAVVRSTRRRRLLVPILVRSPGGLEPALFSVSGSSSENAGWVSSAEVVMKTRRSLART